MIKLYDFQNCLPADLYYGGNAGKKKSILFNNEPWIIKYPQNTKLFNGKHLASYITGPISEYIGSHLYQALGIPVHKTILGSLDGKIVVACKDFAVNKRIVDFAALKNSAEEELLQGSAYGSSARGEKLNTVLSILKYSRVFDNVREAAIQRFWDMFVIDAFILNNDRSNSNWGVFIDEVGNREIVPVFDNGNCLFNRRNVSACERAAQDTDRAFGDLGASVSFFTDDADQHIHPFDLMGQHRFLELDNALVRFSNAYSDEYVSQIIDNIPEYYNDLEVMTSAQKKFYIDLLLNSANKKILPAAREVIQNTKEHTSPTTSATELLSNLKQTQSRSNLAQGINRGVHHKH